MLEIWSDAIHVKHSLLEFHQCKSQVPFRIIPFDIWTDLTAILLLIISYFPASSHHTSGIAFEPSFITGIGHYISHMDKSVRTCGMLVAEVVAQRSLKKLDFGDWAGDEDGKLWAREIRALIVEKDADARVLPTSSPRVGLELPAVSDVGSKHQETEEESTSLHDVHGHDSDDSLSGYASPTSSTRSVSPTPSELNEIERDPSLTVRPKKPHRPVYLVQLGDMVRSAAGSAKNDASEQADKLELALSCGEALIRRKMNFGTELSKALNTVPGKY